MRSEKVHFWHYSGTKRKKFIIEKDKQTKMTPSLVFLLVYFYYTTLSNKRGAFHPDVPDENFFIFFQPTNYRMGRPKKEKPNRKDGCYEVKITIGTAVDGTLIRKSFYSDRFTI